LNEKRGLQRRLRYQVPALHVSIGSSASILARPLSATPDITTSDRAPSACRLPTPDHHRMSRSPLCAQPR